MTECIPGVNGTCLAHKQFASAQKTDITYSGTNLFCLAFYQDETGSTKKTDDLDLLRTQLFLGASIFGCESYRVFSDISTWLSPGKVETIKVDDVEGNFHFAKRKFNGHWINSNMFIQVWKKVKEENMWSSKDWTVKVDADSVFLPMRLREYLSKTEVTSNGIYLENCKNESFGFYGSLEVFSHRAMATYLANIDNCKATLNYMGREKLHSNEPWGEDLFAQRCMDLHGVDRVDALNITTDALCEGCVPKAFKKQKKGSWKPDCATTYTPVIHPMMKSKDYFDCLKATQR